MLFRSESHPPEGVPAAAGGKLLFGYFLWCKRKYPACRGGTRQPLGRMPENLRRGNPSNPTPSAAHQPKGGGRLVSTHAALSPELGSSLKARSGCKSGTTAPGVQGAGRGPLATSLVTFLFAQESNPPVGAGPDNPSGRMPENAKERKPLPQGEPTRRDAGKFQEEETER